MECYFGSFSLPDHNQVEKTAVVAFHIPQVGIRFKAAFDGADTDHSDLASLLALLEFIDTNQKYFANRTYQIYGNNLKVVNLINRREQVPGEYVHLLEKAFGYRHKYRFSLEWIPARDNPLFDTLFD